MENNEPEITKTGMLSCQVCVPETYSDDDVISFTETYNPCGTEHGWQVRKEGDELLNGDPERVPCSMRKGFVHIMLDA